MFSHFKSSWYRRSRRRIVRRDFLETSREEVVSCCLRPRRPHQTTWKKPSQHVGLTTSWRTGTNWGKGGTASEEGTLCQTSSLGFFRRSWQACDGAVLGKVLGKVLRRGSGPAGGSGPTWHGRRAVSRNQNESLVFRGGFHWICAGARAGRRAVSDPEKG